MYSTRKCRIAVIRPFSEHLDKAGQLISLFHQYAEGKKFKIYAEEETLIDFYKETKDRSEIVLIFDEKDESKPLGFAIFSNGFNIFKGREVVHLDEVFITPHAEGRGYFSQLLKYFHLRFPGADIEALTKNRKTRLSEISENRPNTRIIKNLEFGFKRPSPFNAFFTWDDLIRFNSVMDEEDRLAEEQDNEKFAIIEYCNFYSAPRNDFEINQLRKIALESAADKTIFDNIVSRLENSTDEFVCLFAKTKEDEDKVVGFARIEHDADYFSLGATRKLANFYVSKAVVDVLEYDEEYIECFEHLKLKIESRHYEYKYDYLLARLIDKYCHTVLLSDELTGVQYPKFDYGGGIETNPCRAILFSPPEQNEPHR